MINKDKNLEKERYENSSQLIISKGVNYEGLTTYRSLALFLQTPYIYYEKIISEFVSEKHSVIEIGSGRGDLTDLILSTGAKVTATDISPISLAVLKQRYSKFNNLEILETDMENLLTSQKFDSFCSAGSLSYGNIDKIISEAQKVLKKDGLFICVDSLNNNLIYKFNRYIAYLIGKRSLSTIRQMPTVESIKKFETAFEVIEIKYFGSLSWLMKILAFLIREKTLAKLSNYFDSLISTKKSAFKFVMIAKLK